MGEKIIIRVRVEKLDRGGYTSFGRYFGIGQPLFFYGSDDGDISNWIRAKDKADAKRQIKALFPHAKVQSR